MYFNVCTTEPSSGRVRRHWQAVGIAAAFACVQLVYEVAQADPLRGLTPKRYFECQIAVRKASLAGMEKRAAAMAKVTTAQQLESIGDQSAGQVQLAFNRCGYGPAELAPYAHRYREELRTWLVMNPQVEAQMTQEAHRINGLSAQMRTPPRSAAR